MNKLVFGLIVFSSFIVITSNLVAEAYSQTREEYVIDPSKIIKTPEPRSLELGMVHPWMIGQVTVTSTGSADDFAAYRTTDGRWFIDTDRNGVTDIQARFGGVEFTPLVGDLGD